MTDENTTLRLFIAMDIGDAVRGLLTPEIKHLKKSFPKIKWVSPENIHLTLAFLGDVPGERVEGISRVLDALGELFTPFSMNVTGLGTFGPPRSPRVIRAGIGAGTREAIALQAMLADELRALDFTPETRPFSPHLTIGRVKSSRDAEGLSGKLAASSGTYYGTIRADHLRLMRSELRPQGPIYTVVHETKLLK